MPCSSSSRSLAALHFSGSPTSTGTICVVARHHRQAGGGKHRLGARRRDPAGARAPSCDVLRWRIEAVAAAQIAGGSAVVKMKPGA